MDTTEIFVSLTDLAAQLGVGHATVRRWAGRAAVPLFRPGGGRDALVRRSDIARLRAMLAATVAARALAAEGPREHPARSSSNLHRGPAEASNAGPRLWSSETTGSTTRRDRVA